LGAAAVEEVCALASVGTAAENEAAGVEVASVESGAAGVEAASVDTAAVVVDAADPKGQQPSEPSES
jgi:hypothetical protein